MISTPGTQAAKDAENLDVCNFAFSASSAPFACNRLLKKALCTTKVTKVTKDFGFTFFVSFVSSVVKSEFFSNLLKT